MASVRKNRRIPLPATPRRTFHLHGTHIRPDREDGALHPLFVIMTPVRPIARLLLVIPDLAHAVHADLLRHVADRDELTGAVVLLHDQSLALVVTAMIHGRRCGSVEFG